MPHLTHAHKSITTLQGEDIVFLATDINLPGAVDWVMMQFCFSHHFMLVLEKQEKYEGHQQFFAIVLLIGTRKQAENFAYRLELNGNRRRLTWEATPRSIHDGVAAAIMNSDCLVFDTAIAHLFADNGNLGINVTISTCCPWASMSFVERTYLSGHVSAVCILFLLQWTFSTSILQKHCQHFVETFCRCK